MLFLSLLEIIYVVHSRGSQYPEILSVQVFILYTPNVILVVDHDGLMMTKFQCYMIYEMLKTMI